MKQALQCAGLWERLKDVIRPTHIGYLIGHMEVEAAMQRSWADSLARHGIDRDHALADARALRSGFLARHGGETSR